MADKLPKVSIAVVGVVIAQIGGFIWWTAQQASTIQNLEETVNVLTVENNATDRTNLIRDVERNTEDLQEIIDILSEVYEDMEDADTEIWEEVDQIHQDIGGMARIIAETMCGGGHMSELDLWGYLPIVVPFGDDFQLPPPQDDGALNCLTSNKNGGMELHG